MPNKNSCYTYFKICGKFDSCYVSNLLNLTPERISKIGEVKNGKTLDTATWEVGKCNDYDVYVSNQMRKTISVLLDKTHLLNKLRKEFDVKFYLVVVPELYLGGVNPCLSPELDIIDFCHETRTEIDIDLYVYND